MAERDEERENQKGFRVVDRRRFTAEGEARQDGPAEPPPAPPRAEPPPQRGRPEPKEREPEARPPQGPAAGEPGLDFLSFAASLATNALAAMGALPEAQARGLPRSPELAKEYIDILAMLQQKTRGNLTREEDQALQQMLTELRLHFVEASRARR